jgi:outer membrane protein insertion porin family
MSRRKRNRRRLAMTGGLAGLALLGSAANGFAQPPPVKVTSVSVTNVGPLSVSESLIRANIKVKTGDAYNRMAVDDDVRGLYSTGLFNNIRVVEDITTDGVTLTYVLQGKLKITDILFTGNKKYSTRKLNKKVTSKVGEPLDERKLFADAQEIKKLYQKKGLQKTEVKYVVNSDEPAGRATVTFEIIEAPKLRAYEVIFEGARAFPQKKLRKVVKTRRHWMFSWITRSDILKDDQLEDDKDRLTEFYRNAGYIDFELKDFQIETIEPGKVRLRYVVSEGNQYKVGSLDIKGTEVLTTNQLQSKLAMPAGSTFTPPGLEKDIEALRDAYGTQGYIDARVLPRRMPNTQTGKMDLSYEIEEGNKSYIEKIEIRGNTKTKDRVIRRELAVTPGEPFDTVRVKLSKQRLEGLNYFDRVETAPEPTDVPDRRNLVVTVAEGNTGHFSIGAGFNTVDSVVGTLEVTQANFDLFNPPWFTGGGQKLRLRLTYGYVIQNYSISFVEPWFLGRKLALSTDLYHSDYNNVSVNDLYSERRTGARVGLSRALGSDFLIGGISYTIENVNLYDVDPFASPEIQQEAGSRLVSQVGASLTYDTRNSAIFPTKGQRTELRPSVAGGFLGGDTDFYRLELRHTRYFPGLFEGHVLELGGRIGVVEAWDDSPHVPLFDRWFLGGIYSLRGYRYRDVGPRDYLGEPVGGSTYWFATAEYSIPIIERLRFAIFYDVGMVYQKAYSFDSGYVLRYPSDPISYRGGAAGRPGRVYWSGDSGFYNDNWGVGLRLNLPIGPLRLDYGVPITSDESNGGSGRFQFSVGYTRDF